MKPALFTLEQVRYWETLATVSLRRLFPMRSRAEARGAIRQWVAQLHDCRRVRAYRNWAK